MHLPFKAGRPADRRGVDAFRSGRPGYAGINREPGLLHFTECQPGNARAAARNFRENACKSGLELGANDRSESRPPASTQAPIGKTKRDLANCK
jgi:hypothetical protein